MTWLRVKLAKWLGEWQAEWNAQISIELAELRERMKDVELNFATGRNARGQVTETLDQVSLEERRERRRLRGASPGQRKAVLEAREALPTRVTASSN